MSVEFGLENEVQLIEALKKLAAYQEIDIPGRGIVHTFFNPHGIEMGPFIDVSHMPRITNFTTVALSGAFANLRHINPLEEMDGSIDIGDGRTLHRISTIAADLNNYSDTPQAKFNRIKYRASCVAAMRGLLKSRPIEREDIIAPVKRCGSNIADGLLIDSHQRVDFEAKRLRLAGMPNLLASATNMDWETANKMKDKRVRLMEGVVAAGSTVDIAALAFRWYEVDIQELSTDAVIVCPAGANFAADFRRSKFIGLAGREYGAFNGGTLDDDWYVRYHPQDPLLSHFDKLQIPSSQFIGLQVLGDGGDLTS